MRTVAQITDLLETVKKKGSIHLLSRARPALHAATLMHVFDVMVNQHTSIFEWKRNVVLFEQDFKRFLIGELREALQQGAVHLAALGREAA